MRLASSALALVLILAPGLMLAGCGTSDQQADVKYDYPDPFLKRAPKTGGGLFSGDGVLDLFGGADDDPTGPADGGGGGGTGIGVNAYLWRAALDTLSFIPVTQADPFGGTILTDWYTPAEAGGQERFKVNVLILDGRLTATALKVAVFRQSLQGGGWVDAPASPETERALEDSILARARELRRAG